MHNLKQLIKEYPASLMTFLLYVLMWLLIAMRLYDMHRNPFLYRHGETTYYLPLLGFLLAFFYLIILIIIAFRSKPHRHFYSRLAIFASIPVFVAIVLVMNEIN